MPALSVCCRQRLSPDVRRSRTAHAVLQRITNDGPPAPVRAFAWPRGRMAPESARPGVPGLPAAGAVSGGCRAPGCRVRARGGIEAGRRRARHARRVDALRRTGEDRPRRAPDGVLRRRARGVGGCRRPDPAAETGAQVPRGDGVVCLLGGALGHRPAGRELWPACSHSPSRRSASAGWKDGPAASREFEAVRRLGAVIEGVLRQSRPVGGGFADQILWSVLATEWTEPDHSSIECVGPRGSGAPLAGRSTGGGDVEQPAWTRSPADA